MMRGLSVVLGLALLGFGAWLVLREDRVNTAAAPGRSSEGSARPAAAAEDGVDDRRDAALDSSEQVGAAEETADAEAPAPTGVLAGRLLLDGGPLPEAATLTLAPDAKLRERPAAEVTLETDALGRFRCEGLIEDWSGRLLLWLPYRLPGDEPWGTSALRVDALSESLAIDVVRVPCLRGRLTHAEPELVSELGLGVRLYSPDGGYTELHRQTDPDGRLWIPLSEPELSKVRVEATASDGAHCSVLRERDALEHDPSTGDYDLGDLVLRGGFEAHVRVLDPELVPVEDAQVLLRGVSLPAPARTDSQGEVRFPVPDSATEMRVAASGFAFQTFPLPFTTARLDFVLRRTNRLRVEVFDAQGEPWAKGRLLLRSEGGLYASGNATPPSAHVRGGRVFDARGNVDELGPYHLFVTRDDGAIELQDLSADVALDVEAVDALGRAWVAAHVAGLGPEESRVVELLLPAPGPRIRGRCTDVHGAPVAVSKVVLQHEHESVWLTCTPDGDFEAPPLARGKVLVGATATGFARSAPRLVDATRGEVLLVLDRGRTVQVELVDERGQTVSNGELRLRDPATELFWSANSAGNLYTFRDVPIAPLEAEFEWFSRRVTTPVRADQERVVLTVEALGRLIVTVDASVPDPEEWLNLRLTALDGPAAGAELVTHSASHSAVDPLDRERSLDLWPGRYEVQLLEFRMDERRRPLPSVPYLRAAQVEVTGGETTRLTLGARD